MVTLIIYKIVLLGIGFFASGKTKDGTDFFLGGRSLGPTVAALSASASSSSAWTLLGVSGAAYAGGLSAAWIFPACVGGFLINWCLLGPGLRRESAGSDALTVSEVLAGPPGTPQRHAVSSLGSFIVVVSLATYVATQFQGAGKTFSEVFGLSTTESILIGAGIVVIYTMMGGFWAVSLTDSLQGFLMMGTSLLLPIAALYQVGGPGELWSRMQAIEGFSSLGTGGGFFASLGFVAGLLGIGLGYPGQPHVVNRFMALKDEESMARGRTIAIGWAVVVYAGMLVLGWCGRILYPGLPDKEVVFLSATTALFPPVVAGIMIAAVLSAIMSTADSQLLVLVSSLTHDINLDGEKDERLLAKSRAVILLVSAFSVMVALYGPKEIFNFVLFAWSAMGAAFGPLLLVTVLRGRVNSQATIAAMSLGFVLSVAFYLIPATKGGFIERVLPWCIALGVAVAGSSRENR
ncbi:MAG: sodium/proline symporter [Candidatus Eremiobacteraeota bacterium]|nr:sodium/proline symporter [Candidatus Eremiobacteraeota bacterium]